MVTQPAGVSAYDRLDALFKFGVVGDLSDAQLVHRFMTARGGGDQAAFTALDGAARADGAGRLPAGPP